MTPLLQASFSGVASTLALTWSLLSLAPAASAQELNLGPIIDPMVAGNAAAQRQIAEQEYKRATGRDPRRVPGSETRTKSSASTVHSSGSTRFRVDAAARARRAAAWMSQMRAIDAQGAAQMQRTLAGRNVLDFIGPQMTRYGLRSDDLADAMAVYLVTAWYGVRGSNQDPPRAHLLATRNQMRAALLANPAFASTSNATKQQTAENLLLGTIEADAYISGSKNNPTRMAKAKSLIRQDALHIFHLDLTKLKLTNRGLGL